MRQVWRHLGFFHWPIDAQALARLLPPGLQPDTFEGIAYVGVVPFTIPLSRAAGLPVPLAPAFHELNLRTYVHHQGRSPGVWFFSLDASSWLAVAGARTAYALPYFPAAMTVAVADETATPTITYESIRSLPTRPPAQFRAHYGPTGPSTLAQPGTLEFFLVERYRLYSWNGRRVSEARVHHAPYPLRPAAVSDLTETLTSAAGLSSPDGPPTQAHYADQITVDIFRPHRSR